MPVLNADFRGVVNLLNWCSLTFVFAALVAVVVTLLNVCVMMCC